MGGILAAMAVGTMCAAGPVSLPAPALHRVTAQPGVGIGPTVRLAIEVLPGADEPEDAFTRAVDAVLLDERGWTNRFRLRRVTTDPDIRIVLAPPADVDRLCAPLHTSGSLSCFQRGRAVINASRWHHGATSYGANLHDYRTYLINHEVGHGLGFTHRGCPAPGALAPVMLQQTKGLAGCQPNPWPAS